MSLRFLRVLLLSLLVGASSSCNRLKKKAPAPEEAPKPGAVPEIVDEPAEAAPAPEQPPPVDPAVPGVPFVV